MADISVPLSSLPAFDTIKVNAQELLYALQSQVASAPDTKLSIAQLLQLVFSPTVQALSLPPGIDNYVTSGSNAHLRGYVNPALGSTAGEVVASENNGEFGDVRVLGGNAATGINRAGGSVNLTGGSGAGTQPGGAITMVPGPGGSAQSSPSYVWINLVAGDKGGPVPVWYITGLPTSDPHDPDAIWLNNNVLTRSAG